MVEEAVAAGQGSAHNAAATAVNEVGELEAALAEARARQNADQPRLREEAARAAIAKAEEHLAGAHLALERVLAENAAEAANLEAAIAEKTARRQKEADEQAAAVVDEEGN